MPRIACSTGCAWRCSGSSRAWRPPISCAGAAAISSSVATQDVELVEYFFAHTVAPALVAVLIPAYPPRRPRPARCPARPGAAALPGGGARQPHPRPRPHRPARLRRARGVRRHERARGGLGAGARPAPRLPGHGRARRRLHRAGAPVRGGAPAAPPRPRAAGLVAGDGHWRGRARRHLDRRSAGGEAVPRRGTLPLLTLLAMSAFVPIWEIAQVGRQLADSLGAARRLHAIHAEAVPVRDGEGVSLRAGSDGAQALGVELLDVSFTYPGRVEPALRDVSLSVPAGTTAAIVGPSGGRQEHAGGAAPPLLGIRTAARCGSPAPMPAAIGWTICVAGWRWWPRTPISSTSRSCRIFFSRVPARVRPRSPRRWSGASLGEFVAALPGRARHGGGRARDAALGRAAPARGHRASLPQGLAAPLPLILDEATSHLDVVNEQAVHEALERLARDLDHPHHRPPALHGAARRRDHRARRRPPGGGGPARGAAGARRPLRPPSSRASLRPRPPGS